jgi:hypothetical protein
VPATDAVYCTIFDAGYLAQALALHASLIRHSRRARFAFFCTDTQSAELLGGLSLERATVVPYAQLASAALDRVRAERSPGEFSWTCKPFALQYLSQAMPDSEWLIYLDADMLFFADADAALPAQAHYLLAPHRFHPAFAAYQAAGRFNAGYVAMRNSPLGLDAIRWWGERCIESCSAEPSAAGYADQGYLDQFPALFPYGEASGHLGLDAAPWNIENYRVEGMAGGANGATNEVRLDGVPLLLYHFQSLRILNSWLVDLYAGDRRLSAAVREFIYAPYLDDLQTAYRRLRESAGASAPGVRPRLISVMDWLRLARGRLRGRHNLLLRRMAA